MPPRSIYGPSSLGTVDWITPEDLESRLATALVGQSVGLFALRTRSKFIKSRVCEALGYEVPPTFRRTQPRFPAQELDVYVQQSNNLQVWNQEVSPTRRYAIVRPDLLGVIKCVKIVLGTELASWDRTGTLTRKYQARYKRRPETSALSDDTATVQRWQLGESEDPRPGPATTASDAPLPGRVVGARRLHATLVPLIGRRIPYHEAAQERVRAFELHRLVAAQLGFADPSDTGSFPDIPSQLLEVKLQTSPTVDLGLSAPDSNDPLPGLEDLGLQIHDVRYAVFFGRRDGTEALLENLVLVSGHDFFRHFDRFEGLGVNQKLQIPLPKSLFENC